MPRRRLDDDDDYADDMDPRPGRRSSGTGLVVGLVVGGALLALLLVIGAGALFFARTAAVRQEAVAARDDESKRVGLGDEEAARRGKELARERGGAAKAYTRAEFSRLVTGKTGDEIIAAVGRPDETRKNVPGETKRDGVIVTETHDWFIFRDRVLNDETGKPFWSAEVRFNAKGRADRIDYRLTGGPANHE
jgi:hypothetical protein